MALFVSLLAPIGPKLVLRPHTPKATFLQLENIFPVKLDKILHKIKHLFLKIG